MKSTTKLSIGFVVILVAIIIIIQFTGDDTSVEPGKYDTFAQCITASGAKMYGAYWCPHCQNQKEAFGDSWQYVDYVECDPRGDDADPEACEAAGITGYPTWIFGNGERRPGEVPFEELAFRTNCTLPA